MFGTLVVKELKAILGSPKFYATFGVCSLLILLSVHVGIQEYREAQQRQQAGAELAEQEMREQTSWMRVGTQVQRQPVPLQVFVAGVDLDVGRLSAVNQLRPVKLTHAVYEDDPLFAVFRFVDFAFIVQVVLSLFALLFAYDAVSGEREHGTLRLVFAGAVPRAPYLLAKLTGLWLGLVVPLTVPILLSVLLVLVRGVTLGREDWLGLLVLGGTSLLYFTFFLVLGLLASTLARRSSTSFLFALVAWLLLVLVAPRVGVMLAGQLRPVPNVAQVEGQLAGFAKQRWAAHFEEMQETGRRRAQATEGMTPGERQAWEDENLWDWLKESEASRGKVQADIDAQAGQVRAEQRNLVRAQEALALGLARLSPAALYQVATSQVAGTDHHLKTRYEDALEEYRQEIGAFIEKKEGEGGGGAGVRIQFSSDSGFKIDAGRDAGRLDLSGLPRFEAPRSRLGDTASAALIDVGFLAGWCLLAFVGAFVAFLRYDVR